MSVAEPLIQASLLGEAIERGPIAALLVDETLRHVAANGAACKLLGYERAELLKLSVLDVARDHEAQAGFEDLQAKGRRNGTCRVTRKDGRELTLRYRAGETVVAGMTLYVFLAWQL